MKQLYEERKKKKKMKYFRVGWQFGFYVLYAFSGCCRFDFKGWNSPNSTFADNQERAPCARNRRGKIFRFVVSMCNEFLSREPYALVVSASCGGGSKWKREKRKTRVNPTVGNEMVVNCICARPVAVGNSCTPWCSLNGSNSTVDRVCTARSTALH